MNQVREKLITLAEYPYHLPDKPLSIGKNGKISYEEFFDWADEDTLAEWVDGRIEMSSPASWQHQEIAGLLYEAFRIFVRIYDLGVVVQNPFQMKLPGKRGSGREADVMFLAKANLSRLESGLIRGPADLVVEVVSPESEWRDRHDKFREYAAGGVAEYWLIDPTQNQAEFYQLGQDGQYQAIALDSEGKIHFSALPGFWLRPEWLWRSALPRVERVLKTICGPAYEAYLNRQLQSEEDL